MWRLRREFCACFAFVRFLLPLPSDILARSRFLSVSVSLFFYFFLIFFVLVSAAVVVVVFLFFSLCSFFCRFSLFRSEFGCLARERHNEICCDGHSLFSLCMGVCVCARLSLCVCVCPAA